ncbi:MAG: ribosomal protection-like ABC-F family protein [Bacillota bacterium]
MIALAIKELEKYYGATRVLYNITMEISEEEKVAIIGSNGCGKTTLFKVIAGMEKSDGGMLALKKNIKIGYLEQITGDYPGKTTYEVLTEGMQELLEMKRQMEQMEEEMTIVSESHKLDSLMKRYGLMVERFEALDGYNMDSSVKEIAEGLSIPEELFERSFELLSGGEKTRVLFARMLIAQPELLLLDEPTNHLDIESVEWLEGFLRNYKGTVMIISHDRYFLDKAVSRIIEMEEGGCTNYNGNYTCYVQEKERKLLVEFENYQDQQKKIKHMEEAIKRLRDWGNRGDNEKFFKKAASIQKALDRMEKIKKPVMERRKAELSFDINERSGKEVILCDKLCKAYGEKVLFEDAEMLVRFRDKVGILGANGTGKSTLIRMILEQEQPDNGSIKVGPSVRIGYLEQSVYFEDENRTILEEFRYKFNITEGEARSTLARFLFYKDSVFKKLRDLSGGEKTRLRLAELMYEDVNLLVLDEPTNHLDIDTRESLEETLEEYEGTILFISHDRYFVNKLADRLYNIEDKKLVSYCGNYDYFKEKYVKPITNTEPKKVEKTVKKIEKPVPENNNKEVERIKLEKEIELLELELAGLRAQMDAPENTSDYRLLEELSIKHAELEESLNKKYYYWEILS